jgi:hypothetical protein
MLITIPVAVWQGHRIVKTGLSSVEGCGRLPYRDFYRDAGFDLEYEYMKRLHPDGVQ